MVQISLRVDENVKKEAEKACEDIGISMATAINIYLKKLGRERRIPFELTADPFYSDKNMVRLKKAINDLNEGKGSLHEVDYE